MRLVLGGTTGDTDSYTLAITKRRADIGQGILRTDIKRRAAIGHLVGKVGRAWRVGAGFQFERFGRLEPFTIIVLPRNVWAFCSNCNVGVSILLEVPAMPKKVISALSAVVVMSVRAFGARAAEKLNYDAKSFAAAQAAGKPILVEIHATWCPTCKAQAPILSDLEKQDKFKNLMVFRVDFDSQKDAVKAFGARMQSTLITFKGSQETGRSVGDTNPSSIAALLDKTT